MFKKLTYLFLAACLALFVVSCKKETVEPMYNGNCLENNENLSERDGSEPGSDTTTDDTGSTGDDDGGGITDGGGSSEQDSKGKRTNTKKP
jgi:hypothetical protein